MISSPTGFGRLRPSLLLAGSALALVLAAAPHASADCASPNSTCIDSDVLWPTPGPTTFFSIASGTTTAPRRFSFGLGNSLQGKPIVLRKSDSGPAGAVALPAIGTQLTTSFLFSYGVSDRLQADVAAPVTFYQDGTGLSSKDGAAVDVPSSVVRDLRVGMAYALVPFSRIGVRKGVAVVARFDLSIPTGDREFFAGDRSLVASPSFAIEERIGPLVLGAQLGLRLRRTVTLFNTSVGSQAYFAGGVAGHLDKKGTLAVTSEIFTLPSLVSNGTSPVQWLGGLRWSGMWGGDLVVHAGGGGGFRSSGSAQLLEPAWRAVLDIRYAPLGLDRDGDGVLDKDDKCPDEPEDRDGFEDADGCPDPDNDHDGIPDKLDKCPNEAEDIDGFEDDDGCPEKDTDGDGIKDKVDKCPNEPEDKNGYEDGDGCPEGGPPALPSMSCADGTVSKPGEKCDVDHDGITDDVDLCPRQAEDFDKIADEDGCPEKDADEDGIADELDKCPLEPETINGKDDDDGCPEPGATSLVTFSAGAIEVENPVRFANGSTTVTKPMRAQIAMIAQRLQGLVDRGVEKIVIEGWADTAGDTLANQKLAQKRAEALVKELVATGIPEGLIKATVGDLGDPPAKTKANYLVTVRTKRKGPIGKPLAPKSTPPPNATPAKP